jgi:hypothetical protein
MFDYYAFIPHHGDPRLLLLRAGGRWTLPHFRQEMQQFWQNTDHINAALYEMLGIETTVLRCLYVGKDSSTGHSVRIYDMENHSVGWEPPTNFRWIAREELDDLPLSVLEHRPYMEEWFAEAAGKPVSPLRPAWARRGWFEEVSGWIESHLVRLGVERTGPVVQLRAWQRSCVLRVPTSSGDFYFKALPPMFAFEIPLLKLLAEKRPSAFPTLLAVDETRHRMLVPDFGGMSLDKIREIAVWEGAREELARLQISLATEVGSLLAAGCPDRRLDWLAAGIDGLLSDTSLLTAGYGWLSGEDIARLRSLAPAWKHMCAELATYNVPYSLEHGDLWASNIISKGPGDYLFFDWSDSSISHPFFSVLLFNTEDGAQVPAVPESHNRLREAYLRPWLAYEPMDRLLRAFDLAQTLAPLHAALIYQTRILPNMEARWEMENMPPFFLRMLLKPEGRMGR